MLHRTPFFLPYLFPQNLLWRVPVSEKVLFLTFDDGPVPGPTEFVLNALRAHNALATFFCIGDNIEKYPGVFNSVIAQGHCIGNHTFNHLNGWKTPVGEYLRNTSRCQEVIDRFSSEEKSRYFRPPYGRITRHQIRELDSYQIVMWDVLARDYDKKLSPERCLRNTLSACRPGSIIVFHDSYKAQKNLMWVLPRFLEACSQNGFVFRTLPPRLQH